MASDAVSRPVPARATFALFAAVIVLHLLAATTGWRYGMLPGNTFRQAQTALTTYFIHEEGNYSLAYPTPVLGKPWSIPMEFPLYEWTVAALTRLTGLPLVECARFVTLACFYLALPGLWLLLRELGVDPGRRWLVLAFVPACPVYIFYSRAFLIESMALMFSLWFVAALLAGLRRNHRGWLAAAAVAGIGAILVKITTLMLFLAPVGVALAWQLWLAWRGPPGKRPEARRCVRQAGLTLVLPLVIGAAWVLYSDSVKVHNAAADMLRSGPQRAYNFGQWSDRISGDYWHRWLDLSSHAVVYPWVFAGMILLMLVGPRRWRWPIAAGFALFVLAPAVFPFLYAWHDYYYYANAGFLGVALGFAAVALLDSRLPRWLGVIVILGALALQGRLYLSHYWPMQRIDSNGDSGLAQFLFDLTDKNDVLVVAGQDWNSELPYTTRRRALMIRRGYETNFTYLEQAFSDLKGEFVAALVLTGDTRNNRRLVELAGTKLNIHPEPFLEFLDHTVYVNRALRDEWSGRALSFPYDRVHLLHRNESARPVLSGAVKDLHGKAVFESLRPQPVRYEVPFVLSMFRPTTRFLLNTHATTHLWFEPAPGSHQATLEYGVLDSAWQRPDPTDGVEFVVSVLTPDGQERRVWSRLLNPATAVADRGLQAGTMTFDLPAGAQVELSTLPGPHGSNSYDWGYVASFVIK